MEHHDPIFPSLVELRRRWAIEQAIQYGNGHHAHMPSTLEEAADRLITYVLDTKEPS